MIVASADLARPGVTLEAAYWMPADKGGHYPDETAIEWRKRKRLERSVTHVQRLIAKVGVRGHERCHWCDNSGLVFDFEAECFTPCRGRRQQGRL